MEMKKIPKKPKHPGYHLKVYMVNNCLTVTDLAHELAISRPNASRILNQRTRVTIAMALKLEEVGFGQAEWWAEQQLSHDMWEARQRRDQW